MEKGKKYDYRVEAEEGGWKAEIIRRATSKKTVVSKSQGGFASEAEAEAWGQSELKLFMINQNKRNKRHSERRQKED